MPFSKTWRRCSSSDPHFGSSEASPGIHTQLYGVTLLSVLLFFISLRLSASRSLAFTVSLCCTLPTTESVSGAKIRGDTERIKATGICPMLLRSWVLWSNRKVPLPESVRYLPSHHCHPCDMIVWDRREQRGEIKRERATLRPTCPTDKTGDLFCTPPVRTATSAQRLSPDQVTQRRKGRNFRYDLLPQYACCCLLFRVLGCFLRALCLGFIAASVWDRKGGLYLSHLVWNEDSSRWGLL